MLRLTVKISVNFHELGLLLDNHWFPTESLKPIGRGDYFSQILQNREFQKPRG
jgi:hypothetical protein